MSSTVFDWDLFRDMFGTAEMPIKDYRAYGRRRLHSIEKRYHSRPVSRTLRARDRVKCTGQASNLAGGLS